MLLSFVLVSCSKKDDISKETVNPKIQEVEVTQVKATSALVTWEVSISDGSSLTYDLFLADEKIAKNVKEKTFKLKDLKEQTQYSGKIVAHSSKGGVSEKSFSFTTTEYSAPTTVEISITNIGTKSATISWSEATVDDEDSEVLYSVYINGELKLKNSLNQTLVLKNLKSNKEYNVRVVARSKAGKTSEVSSKFRTLVIPPSSFKIRIINSDSDFFPDYDPYYLIFAWTQPIVEDGSQLQFFIYLNDELKQANLASNINDWVFEDLEEGTEYTLKIVAKATNGTEREESLSFVTHTYPKLTDFDLKVDFVDTDAAGIEWTPSSNPEGEFVVYHVYLNGVKAHEETTYIGGTYFKFENLQPLTEYTAKVVATSSNFHPKRNLVKEIKFTTDYEQHPTIKVVDAVLYKSDSSYFPKQLKVTFSHNLSQFRIEKFTVENILISNYLTYPNSVLTNTFSDEQYKKLEWWIHGNGYFYIKDNGKNYRVNFRYTKK